MNYLTKDEILKADDLPTETLEVPEWGGSVLVRGMTGAERDAFEGGVVSMNGKDARMNTQNIRAKLTALCIVTEDGLRIFTDHDVTALGMKSAAALDRVFTTAQRLSGLTNEDVDELAKKANSMPPSMVGGV